MTKFRAGIAAAAAALLLVTLPALPAVAAPAAPSAPSFASDTDGLFSGKITGTAGDHNFSITFVSIDTGNDPIVHNVTTNGSNTFPSFLVPGGYYHVLVKSAAGLSTASWFNGVVNEDIEATRLLIIGGEQSTVNWTLPANPGTIHGTSNALTGAPTIRVDAYGHDVNYPAERISLGSDVFVAGQNWEITGLPTSLIRLVFTQGSFPQSVATQAQEYISVVNVDLNYGAVTLTKLTGNKPAVVRLAGADRYSTAVAIGQDAFPTAPNTVFIVNGENYPDALSAGPAAKKNSAPILLVKPGSIPQVVKNQLADWTPNVIYIIGGPGSVSSAVETQLHTYAPTVTRVFGSDRYATSRAVFTTFFSGTSAKTMYLANGGGFADALGAGPAAAYRSGAVVLIKGTLAHLDAQTSALISPFPDTYPVQIAGGTGTVSNGINSDLYSLTHDHRRRAGADRYKTSAKIVDAAWPNSEVVYLATGANFPDALAASAAAGSDQAPILLIQKTCIPSVAYDQLQRIKPNKIYLVGGPGVLTDALLTLPEC